MFWSCFVRPYFLCLSVCQHLNICLHIKKNIWMWYSHQTLYTPTHWPYNWLVLVALTFDLSCHTIRPSIFSCILLILIGSLRIDSVRICICILKVAFLIIWMNWKWLIISYWLPVQCLIVTESCPDKADSERVRDAIIGCK